MASKPRIGVIGVSQCGKALGEMAHQTGKLIAQGGGVLVCGGMGGVMEAACRGASEAGGLTVGILPGSTARDANRFVDVPIITGMGYTRNSLVVQSSQVIIAIGGRYGTLSEIAFAIQYQIPLIGLNTWKIRAAIKHVKTPEEAVKLAFRMVGQ
ncbi:TIGR00725 family protein [candidate division TA06 bacterium]|uniref:TIGR00725 family protein n=1 Tax=candidate division TA06 bacterium TaxID=2250710 RepID=A0A933I9Q2_UNCT6|nr:TIGR00725 family protein [candidate division TA06 bacterium]